MLDLPTDYIGTSMRQKLTIIGAIVVMLIGIGILIGTLIYFPSPRIIILTMKKGSTTFRYDIDPNYGPALRQMLAFLVLGCLLSGFGLGMLTNIYAVRRSQKID